MRAIGILVIASGCASTVGEESGDRCTVILEETTPARDATNVYHRSPFEALFSSPDASVEVSVHDEVAELPVPGVLTSDPEGTRVRFQPDLPLSPQGTYRADVTWCDGAASESIVFTTSALGEPLASPEALAGRVFEVDLQGARFTEPGTAGDAIREGLALGVFLAVKGVRGDVLETYVALGVEGQSVQDTCLPTIALPDADFTQSPYWEIHAAQASFVQTEIVVEVEALDVSGTFAADGSYWGGGSVSAAIDTEPVVGLIGSDDPHAICDLAESFGSACVPCLDGRTSCLPLAADQIVATASPVVVEVIEQANCYATCEASVDNPDCDAYYGGGT